MSSRRRRAVEPAPEESEEEQEEQPAPEAQGLRFNQPISWKAGRPIATTELVRRLDILSKELTELDQDWEHKESLNKVAKELCSSNILGHKDKGVKAFAACCLVDILKVCAPDAPFTPSQLKVLCPRAHAFDNHTLTFSFGRIFLPSSLTTLLQPFKTPRRPGTISTNTSLSL